MSLLRSLLKRHFALGCHVLQQTFHRFLSCLTKGDLILTNLIAIYFISYLFLQIEDIYKSLTNLSQEEKITKLLMLKLRYFTPKEIASLLGFPPEFGMWRIR